MKYFDGTEVKLGDQVRLGQDDGGVVVGLIDTGEYCEGHSVAQWGYLRTGVMVDFPSFGLIHYEAMEEDIEFIRRGLMCSEKVEVNAAWMDEEYLNMNVEEAVVLHWQLAATQEILEHEHCMICTIALPDGRSERAYVSDKLWLCSSCYDKFLPRSEGVGLD